MNLVKITRSVRKATEACQESWRGFSEFDAVALAQLSDWERASKSAARASREFTRLHPDHFEFYTHYSQKVLVAMEDFWCYGQPTCLLFAAWDDLFTGDYFTSQETRLEVRRFYEKDPLPSDSP